jgi:phytoene desaturase
LSDVIVVGGGVGGLSCAIHLAKAGLEVHVIEAGDRPGGCCKTTRQDGYLFEDGALWLSQDYLCRGIFDHLGLSFDEFVPATRLDPSTRCLLPDNESFLFKPDASAVAAEVARLSPGDRAHLDRFMAEMARREIFLDRLLYGGPLTWRILVDAGFWRNLRFLLESYEHVVKRYFVDPQVKLAFYRPTLFLGLPPSECPASFILSSYGEITSGSSYPVGGMGRIPGSLREIGEDFGVEFSFGKRVRRIVVERRKALGVELQDGEFLAAEHVVSNAHVRSTYLDLVGSDHLPQTALRKLRHLDLGHSYFMVQLGLDTVIEGAANQPLIPPVNKLADFWSSLKGDIPNPLYPNLAIIPAQAKVAPRGSSVVGIYHAMPHRPEAGTWEERKDRLADLMIDRAEMATGLKLREHIATMRVRTPEDLEADFGLPEGAMYGLAPTWWQSGLGRPRQRSPWIEGLHLTGQTTHPGLGVANAMCSGAMTAKILVEEL